LLTLSVCYFFGFIIYRFRIDFYNLKDYIPAPKHAQVETADAEIPRALLFSATNP
jgi:hypothetical protein